MPTLPTSSSLSHHNLHSPHFHSKEPTSIFFLSNDLMKFLHYYKLWIKYKAIRSRFIPLTTADLSLPSFRRISKSFRERVSLWVWTFSRSLISGNLRLFRYSRKICSIDRMDPSLHSPIKLSIWTISQPSISLPIMSCSALFVFKTKSTYFQLKSVPFFTASTPTPRHPSPTRKDHQIKELTIPSAETDLSLPSTAPRSLPQPTSSPIDAI